MRHPNLLIFQSPIPNSQTVIKLAKKSSENRRLRPGTWNIEPGTLNLPTVGRRR